jgi:hypothetical protein
MAQYIKKAALLAEIERRRDGITKGIFSIPLTGSDRASATFEYEILGKIKDFINTLEVKEVDLELNSFDATVCKICNTYLKEMDKDAIVKALEPYKDGDKVKVIIKAQKGE